MPSNFYSLLHLVGVIMVFLGYGSLIGLAIAKDSNQKVKKIGSITSGIGLSLLLIAGFGLIAKLGYSYTSTWIIIKIIIWILLGGIIAVLNRVPHMAKLLWLVALFLGFVAIFIVYFCKS